MRSIVVRRTGVTAAALLALALAGCAHGGSPAPGEAPTPGDRDGDGAAAAASPADSGARPSVALADSAPADSAAIDTASVDSATVRAAERQTERAVEELDAETRRQFRDLFGTDPLGLARAPSNAERFEIPLETNEAVRWWIGRFRSDIPERFGIYLNRAGRYEPMIREKLREAGLPGDLVYKAMIESGMNPDAYSRAHAVGMWQFIAGTARKYGLEVSYWVDERRDPVAATDAAILYLTDLYEEFGSWYLAAAAYNAGEGRIRWSIARAGTDDYWELVDRRAIPRETRNHVPKIIAAALIARDPAAYGFDVDPAAPLDYETVTVPDATSMDVIAEAAGVDESAVRELNPHFRRHVTPPNRAAEVRLPSGTAERFRVRYAQIPADERVTWLMHTVTRGQTLSGIASRYGTSVRAIVASNDGVRPRRLQIGQQLVVPRAGARGDGELDRGAPEGPTTVVVRRGDTLWEIARRHEISTRELMTWNGLSSSRISPGDRLRVRR